MGCTYGSNVKLKQAWQKPVLQRTNKASGAAQTLPETESVANQGLHWTRGLAHRPGLHSGCGRSLLACLPPWLLLGLASACTWDATPAPATKNTSAGAAHASAFLLLLLLRSPSPTAFGSLLPNHVDDLIRDAKVLDGAASDVAFGHPPELVAVP